MPLNSDESDRLASLDTTLSQLRGARGLSWLDDVAEGSVDTTLEDLRTIYADVDSGPAYTADGLIRSGVRGIWVAWPPPPETPPLPEPADTNPPPDTSPIPPEDTGGDTDPEPPPASDFEVFRLGATYFGMPGSTPDTVWQQDLITFAARGYKVLRVCVNWTRNEPSREQLVLGTGALNTAAYDRFIRFMNGVKLAGMKVDLTFFPGSPNIDSYAAHLIGVTTLLSHLTSYSSSIYCVDVCNEHLASGYNTSQLMGLVNAAKEILPRNVITTSCAADVVTIATAYATLISAGAKIGVLAPHFPRTTDWATQFAARFAALRAAMLLVDVSLPIYTQEEAREGTTSGWSPSAVVTAAKAAKQLKTTCFMAHTDAAYNLEGRGFWQQLSAAENSIFPTLLSLI